MGGQSGERRVGETRRAFASASFSASLIARRRAFAAAQAEAFIRTGIGQGGRREEA
jgi:hypothetical protein